jgi:predicted kinase
VPNLWLSVATLNCRCEGGAHHSWLQRAARMTAAVGANVSPVGTGSRSTRLIVLRGNSGSGKSSVAAEVRARHGRGIALVGQDNLRRIVLRERDVPGGANIGLIGTVARYALDHGFHVIIDGILRADAYGAMLDALRREHQGISHYYYLDVSFEETMRRHATRPQATEFGRAEMSRWYRERDLLPGRIEQVISAENSLEDTVRQVMHEAGLTGQSRDLAVSRGIVGRVDARSRPTRGSG